MKEATMDAKDVDLVELHGQSVKRVRSLCDMHRVPSGAPEDLEKIVNSIRADRHFAMDFWALVGDLSARERGSLSDEEMLDVIVEASTGAKAAAVSADQQLRLEELRQLLAGVDIGRPADLPDAIAKPEDTLKAPGKDRHRFSKPAASVSQSAPPIVVLPERNKGGVRIGARVRLAGAADALGVRRSIGEALSRIERTSTELREQLAAIDQQLGEQISQAALTEQSGLEEVENHESAAVEIEPGLSEQQESVEKTPAPAPDPIPLRSSSLSTPRNPVASRPPAEPERRPVRPQPSKEEPEVFAPRPAHTLSQRGLATPPEDDDRPMAIPLSRYSREPEETHRGRGFAIAALLLILIAGGAFFWTRTPAGQDAVERISPIVRQQYDSFIEKLGVLKREATPRPADTSEETTPSPAPQRPPAPAPTASSPTPAVSSPAPAVSSAPTPQAPVNNPTPEPPRSAREAAAQRQRTSEAPAEPTGANLVDDAATVRVPPAVMDANLISSRVPAYPEYAKAQDIEGRVVMEVVISRTGAVDHVRVVEGDRHLRAAAEEAVLKWRYRPYLVNGRPVDVTTMLRVDFRLAGNRY